VRVLFENSEKKTSARIDRSQGSCREETLKKEGMTSVAVLDFLNFRYGLLFTSVGLGRAIEGNPRTSWGVFFFLVFVRAPDR